MTLMLLSIYFDLCVDVPGTAQQACGFPAWSKTVLYKWTLTLTLTGVVCYEIGLLITDLHAVGYEGFVKMFNYFASSCSSPVKPPMSSAKHRLVIVLPKMLTLPS